ncbi:hypothetical protein PtrV1_03110 [Pyrenophora tritici-repentis]|nr:hypothetical protein PtrV1_03110 [Pyrenophora tritici-repentis]
MAALKVDADTFTDMHSAKARLAMNARTRRTALPEHHRFQGKEHTSCFSTSSLMFTSEAPEAINNGSLERGVVLNAKEECGRTRGQQMIRID